MPSPPPGSAAAVSSRSTSTGRRGPRPTSTSARWPSSPTGRSRWCRPSATPSAGSTPGRTFALDHDDRSGASADGETLRVNLDHHHLFRRLLFFTYLYEGSVSFRELGASVTVSGTAGTFRILLDDAPATAAGCAVALTESDGTGLTVRREVRWFDGHPELGIHQLVDQAYGFGLSWTRMDKPPRLG